MKRLVNGVEVEFSSDADVQVERLSDRLMIRTPAGTHSAVAVRSGDAVHVSYRGRYYRLEKPAALARSNTAVRSGELKAPMPGLVVDVLLAEGAEVRKGDKILVVEAMKVQQAYTAPFDGVIARLAVTKGQQVNEGTVLAVVEPQQQENV